MWYLSRCSRSGAVCTYWFSQQGQQYLPNFFSSLRYSELPPSCYCKTCLFKLPLVEKVNLQVSHTKPEGEGRLLWPGPCTSFWDSWTKLLLSMSAEEGCDGKGVGRLIYLNASISLCLSSSSTIILGYASYYKDSSGSEGFRIWTAVFWSMFSGVLTIIFLINLN